MEIFLAENDKFRFQTTILISFQPINSVSRYHPSKFGLSNTVVFYSDVLFTAMFRQFFL